jgi:hypothetical protein
VVGGDLSIDAPGLIDVHDLTIGGDLDLMAQSGGIAFFDIIGGGYAHLNAFGSITGNDITTTDDIDAFADTGDITLHDLSAGLSGDPFSTNAIRLDAGGSLTFRDASAKGRIKLGSGGPMTGRDVTSGLQISADSDSSINLRNLSAGLIQPQGATSDGFSIEIGSGTSIHVGNVAGAESVGFATLGPITTGTINAGDDLLVMASGDMLLGPITAGGRVYLADSSMFIAAGGGNDEDNFDPELVFAATPVASAGSITIGAFFESLMMMSFLTLRPTLLSALCIRDASD